MKIPLCPYLECQEYGKAEKPFREGVERRNNHGRKLIISKEYLIKNYKIDKRKTEDIATELGVNKSTILRWIKAYGVELNKQVAWNKGIPRPEEFKRRLSSINKGNKNCGVRGEKHHLWKGDNVTKPNIHRWVERNKPKPLHCEFCNKNKPYDLAKITSVDIDYRKNIEDFKWLCRSCHVIMDLERGIRKPRKTNYCMNGHLRTVGNTYINPKGSRVCKECRRAYKKEYLKKKRRENVRG